MLNERVHGVSVERHEYALVYAHTVHTRQRSLWPMHHVDALIPGPDGCRVADFLRAGSSILVRLAQIRFGCFAAWGVVTASLARLDG
jgi:hypothetical protein